MAQDLVPAAAILASESHRGRAVGIAMTGLYLGILLSRVGSGVIAEQFGWRAMFFLAAASIAALGLALWAGLPRFAITTTMGYGQLLTSLGKLWTQHVTLRRAAMAQGLLSLTFSAYWSTLSVLLHNALFHLGPSAAGAFGLAGAAGALAAPVAGRLANYGCSAQSRPVLILACTRPLSPIKQSSTASILRRAVVSTPF